MIKRKQMQQLVKSYKGMPTIVIFGSHSALETGLASKKMGLKNIVVVKKNRKRQYLEEHSHLFDEIIVIDKWDEMVSEEVQQGLLERQGLVIPNRSMFVYLGADLIENKFELPIYGNRAMLKSEDRTTNEKEYIDQYGLLKQSKIRAPREISLDNLDIIGIDKEIPVALVKVQQADNPLERAFFYITSEKEYYEQSKAMKAKGLISDKTLSEARIEEFIIGPYFNCNGWASGLNKGKTKKHTIDESINWLKVTHDPFKHPYTDWEFVGFGQRIQTNSSGFLNLPSKIQQQIGDKIKIKNEEIGHTMATMRESKMDEIVGSIPKFLEIAEKIYPPGMIGLFGLQGAIPINPKTHRPEWVVFDVSMRVPGDPAIAASPQMNSLTLKYKKYLPKGVSRITSPLDLPMIEIIQAFKTGRQAEVVT
jgi:5-formaminoimidazole-4-carboxamide-1-(beta)-D-ribofuranosyl 5'-monophosphate synthetase